MNTKKQILSEMDIQAIIESALFSLSRPLSMKDLLQLFYVERVQIAEIKSALTCLKNKYNKPHFGIELKEINQAYQLRTKPENKNYIRRLIKGRLVPLSAPAMEALVITAYRQPCQKAVIDSIRGVESGHLLKTLLEKDLICVAPPSSTDSYNVYKTTPRFLELFGLKSLKELPSPDEIKEIFTSNEETIISEKSLQSVLEGLKHFTNEGNKETEKELKQLEKTLENLNAGIKNIIIKKEINS